MDLNQKKVKVCINGFKLEERKGFNGFKLGERKGFNGFKLEERKGLY